MNTMWYSIYFMLQDFYKLKEFITRVFEDTENDVEFSAEDWDTIKQLLIALKSFKMLVKLMTSEKNFTVSAIRPVLISIIKNFFSTNNHDSQAIKDFKENSKEKLTEILKATDFKKRDEIYCISLSEILGNIFFHFYCF